MSDQFTGEKPDDIPQSEWDASIAFKNSVDVASMSACEFVARAMMKAREEERAACAKIAEQGSWVDISTTLNGPAEARWTGLYGSQIAAAIRNRKGA